MDFSYFVEEIMKIKICKIYRKNFHLTAIIQFSSKLIKLSYPSNQVDNVKIIGQENDMKPRRFVEACFTKFTSNNINRSIDIPNCYNTILKKNILMPDLI